MTQAELRHALDLGPEWEVLWTGTNLLDRHQHLCEGLYGPGRTYVSEWVTLPYQPTGRQALRRRGATDAGWPGCGRRPVEAPPRTPLVDTDQTTV